MVPLFLQCDGAWWLPLTGLSWLPHALGYCAPLSFQAPSPSSSIVDEFKNPKAANTAYPYLVDFDV